VGLVKGISVRSGRIRQIARHWPLLAAVGFLGLLAACVTVFPTWLLNATTVHGTLNTSERVVDENAIRTTLIQVVGGVFFLATAFFSWRTIQLGREGQLTDRYTKAVEQLGGATTAVRTGGVFALERLAKNSPDDRETIAEVLACFARATSQGEDATLHSASVQAALVVLGRRHSYDTAAASTELNLQRVKADHLYLAELTLALSDLSGADLSEADLSGSDLSKVNLTGARLERAKLSNARLSGAVLAGANLRHADLKSADLSMANLTDAKLDFAQLIDANLSNVDLSDAKLPGANVSDSNLTGAKISSSTVWQDAIGNSKVRWPAGFAPEREGVRVTRSVDSQRQYTE
jgi:uncharacterized protein YjbI with pentapeptide repeats